MNRSRNRQAGFTLIELLVVISVISLISAMMLTTVRDARMKARDARRRGDLKALQTALEIYYDKYNRYPGESFFCDSSIGGSGSACPVSPPANDWSPSGDLRSLVTEGFLPRLPIDPINNAGYYYYYEPDASGQGGCTFTACRYYIWTVMERTGACYACSPTREGLGCPGVQC